MTWSIASYSTTPSSNTLVNGINIAEGCQASGVNDAIRQVMADIATLVPGSIPTAWTGTGSGVKASGATLSGATLSGPTITSATLNSPNLISATCDVITGGGMSCPGTPNTTYSNGINTDGQFNVISNSGGVALSSGATSWSSLSDRTTKVLKGKIKTALAKVASLGAYHGRYKTDKKGVKRVFLVAQEVQGVLPEAVVIDQFSGKLRLDYVAVIPLLVAALNEARARIEKLEAQAA